MEVDAFEVGSFVSCLLLSGFYSGSEAAIISISMERARQLIEEGGPSGEALKYLSNNQNRVLTTILVGNNLVNIFAASLVTSIATRFFDSEAIAFATGITTLLILLFGEIIPKTFARSKAEKLAPVIIRILRVNYYILFPLIIMFTAISKLILGKNVKLTARAITKDDIEFMVNKAEQEKTIDSKQLDLLSSILEFPTIKVKDILVPRSEVKFIDLNSKLEEIMKLASNDLHSRYPVCDGDLDNTQGILHVKSLAFLSESQKKNFSLQSFLRQPFFVYEHMKIQAVFDHMNRRKIHMAIVKNENGLVEGIITLEDIIEEIVGDIIDEHDDDEEIDTSDPKMKLERGVEVEGKLTVREFNSDYDLELPTDEEFSTLGGFLYDQLGNSFPKSGQMILWQGLSFELLKVEDSEIKMVRVKDVGNDKHIYSKTWAEEASKNYEEGSPEATEDQDKD